MACNITGLQMALRTGHRGIRHGFLHYISIIDAGAAQPRRITRARNRIGINSDCILSRAFQTQTQTS